MRIFNPVNFFSKMVPNTIMNAIFMEVERAQKKHPDWPTDMIHAAAIVGEESGELTRAALQWTYEGADIIDAQKEAIQVAATAIRFLIGLSELNYTPQQS